MLRPEASGHGSSRSYEAMVGWQKWPHIVGRTPKVYSHSPTNLLVPFVICTTLSTRPQIVERNPSLSKSKVVYLISRRAA